MPTSLDVINVIFPTSAHHTLAQRKRVVACAAKESSLCLQGGVFTLLSNLS